MNETSAPRLVLAGLSTDRHGPFDLIVQPGECVAITGRSGSGKTVLLRMIADLDPHAGDAWLDGNARSAMPASSWRRQVRYCAAESGWWETFVGAHFAEAAPLQEAAALGLDPGIFNREIRLCSTGERQRLALLRSLATTAPVLLLDEPTGPLDPDSVALTEALLRKRLHSGTAIILVTHDPAQAKRLGHRHFVMAQNGLMPE